MVNNSGDIILLKCVVKFAAYAPVINELGKDIFERCTSTGSEAFSLYIYLYISICLESNKFVLLSFFSIVKRIYPRVSTKPLPNDAKSPLPVDVRRSKTLLLKLPNNLIRRWTSTPGGGRYSPIKGTGLLVGKCRQHP